ncbi:MAG: hypothetical protein MJE63_32620 [Proteobacteria bacterium]|nr:hypothetical protein [Pseudomonadota bacterium]
MSTKKSQKSLTIQQKILKMRKELGLSCPQIARLTGYSLTGVQNYEKFRDPPFKFLQYFVLEQGVRPQFFLEPTDNIVLKEDEQPNQEIAQVVQDVAAEVEYLKSEMAEFKEWKKKQEKS